MIPIKFLDVSGSRIMAFRSSGVNLCIFLEEVATPRYKKGTLHTLKSIIIKDYFLNYLCSAFRPYLFLININVEYLIKLTRIVSKEPTYTTFPVAINNKASKRNRYSGFLLIVSYFKKKKFPAYSVIYFCPFNFLLGGGANPP